MAVTLAAYAVLSPHACFPSAATRLGSQHGKHRFLDIVKQPEHAGHAMHTILLGDLDAMAADIAPAE
jgi:hypothetical protein